MNIDTRRALYGAASRKPRCGRNRRSSADYESGVVWRRDGHAVIMAREFLPYAVARHHHGDLRHQVRAVFVAWRHGQIAGHLIAAWCGGQLLTAELVDEHAPMPARGDCPMCLLRVAGAAAVVVVPRPVSVRVDVEIGGGRA